MALKWSDVTTEKELFDSRKGCCGPEKAGVALKMASATLKREVYCGCGKWGQIQLLP